VNTESALAEARAAEDEIARGDWRGPLHGIPVALKDLIDAAGTRTTAAAHFTRIACRLKMRKWLGACDGQAQ